MTAPDRIAARIAAALRAAADDIDPPQHHHPDRSSRDGNRPPPRRGAWRRAPATDAQGRLLAKIMHSTDPDRAAIAEAALNNTNLTKGEASDAINQATDHQRPQHHPPSP